MKAYLFLVTLSLAIFLVSAFNTKEHVKRFFRPVHRSLLHDSTSLQLEDEPSAALVSQSDESTKCLAKCEGECAERIKVPDFLKSPSSFRKFEFDRVAANCVLASTVAFFKPKYQCQWLELYMFDCCRACNAKYSKCIKKVGEINGGPEFCYRDHYECMCKCLDKNEPPENKAELAAVLK